MDAENANQSCLTSVYLETDRTESLYSPFSDNFFFEKDNVDESTLLDDQLSTHRTTMTVDNVAALHHVSLEDDENYLMEQSLWTSLNRELRNSGYQSVQFKSLSEAIGQHGSAVCFDGNQSAELRDMLASLLNHVIRQAHEIQQAAQLNKQLKVELENSTATNEVLKVKTCKLKALLAAAEDYVSVQNHKLHVVSNVHRKPHCEETRNKDGDPPQIKRSRSVASSLNQFDRNVDSLTNWHSLRNKLDDIISANEHKSDERIGCQSTAFLLVQLKDLSRELRVAAERGIQLEKSVRLLDSQRSHLLNKLKKFENADSDALSGSHCRTLIHDCCALLDLHDVFRLPDEVARLQTSKMLRNQVIELLKSREAPVFSEKIYDLDVRIVAHLKFWLDQLRALPELRQLVNRFCQVAFPWRTSLHLDERNDFWHVADALNSLLSTAEHQFEDCARRLEKAPLSTLTTVVKQFQNLLDPSISNMDPRNEGICQKVSDSRNTLTMLRSLAGLPSGAFVTALSDSITSILRNPDGNNKSVAGHLQSDLKPLLLRMQQYDEFFPVFHSLIEQLKNDLNVSRVDAILPTVRALKSEVKLRNY